MDATKVKMNVGQDGIALLIIDNPPVNSLSVEVLGELHQKFQEAHQREDVKAIVLTGANNKFSGGADIKSMRNSSRQHEGTSDPISGIKLMNTVIEGGPKPAVAAIIGFALGGGLELAMACHARVAAVGSRLGLPELQLGIIPGLGGTQRLPRLVGLQKALDMMLMVKLIKAEEALESGLVDEICDPSSIIELARKYALNIAEDRYPLNKSLERVDRLEPRQKALQIIQQVRNQAKKKHKHVKHPFLCIDVVEYGILNGGVAGTTLERKVGAESINLPTAKALMHVFLSERTVFKVPGVTDNRLKARPIRSAGIVGGGLMGSGIATSLILHKIPVYLKEINASLLEAGLKRIEANLRHRVKKGEMSESQMEKVRGLVKGTLDYECFEHVDLVIEAAVESLPLKRKIFNELERKCKHDCILATNTSSINLDAITKDNIVHQERIVGAHFFSPAHIMRLLEVVRTDKTSPQVTLDLVSLSKTLEKIPIVVKNTIGFAVNRVFFPYSQGATFLVDLGVHPYRIDDVVKDFGMPMGPFRLADLAGIQIGQFVRVIYEEAFGDRMYSSAIGSLLIEDNRLGESSGKGYYKYTGTHKEEPCLGEIEKYLKESRRLAAAKGVRTTTPVTDKEIIEMIFFPIINEACRVIEERVVIRASDLDVASILGMGFPAFRGGIAFWAESVGLEYVLSRLRKLNELHGSLFRPTSSLETFVANKMKLHEITASRL